MLALMCCQRIARLYYIFLVRETQTRPTAVRPERGTAVKNAVLLRRVITETHDS